MTRPQVTIAMAVYNVAPFIREAVDSVLNQSLQDFELLAVNDGSTDESKDILQSYDDSRIRILDQEHQGIARTRNRLLAEATGQYFAVLDPDDVMLPRRLEQQVHLLQARGDVAIVGGQVIEIAEDGRELSRCLTYPIDAQVIRNECVNPKMSILHGTSMLVTAIARESGGYREEFGSIQEDFEWFSRILARHSGVNLPYPVIKYRIRRSSAVGANRHRMPVRVKLVRRQFKRMVAGGPELSRAELAELQATDERSSQRLAQRAWLSISPEGHYYLRVGRAALRGRKWSLARRWYLKALAVAPYFWLPYTGLVRALLHCGGRSECEDSEIAGTSQHATKKTILV